MALKAEELEETHNLNQVIDYQYLTTVISYSFFGNILLGDFKTDFLKNAYLKQFVFAFAQNSFKANCSAFLILLIFVPFLLILVKLRCFALLKPTK